MTNFQNNRFLKINTKLDNKQLLPIRFSGKESVSELFEFQLTVLVKKDRLDTEQLLGKFISFQMQHQHIDCIRHFHGMVNSVHYQHKTMKNYHVYQMQIVPWLWQLKKKFACRIYQNQSVIEIVIKIFKEFNCNDYNIGKIQKPYLKREYCVQYQECYFNFISRILAEEGILFYFQHSSTQHILMLVDSNDGFSRYNDLTSDKIHSQGFSDNNWECSISHSPTHVKISQFDFRHPNQKPSSTHHVISQQAVETNAGKFKYHTHEQQKNYQTVEKSAKLEAEKIAIRSKTYQAKSHQFWLEIGDVFDLTHCDKSPRDKQHIITTINHHAYDFTDTLIKIASDLSYCVTNPQSLIKYRGQQIENHDFGEREQYFCATQKTYEKNKLNLTQHNRQQVSQGYHNSFLCIEIGTPFRALITHDKPIIQGPQTATVISSHNEKIFTDHLARIKVKFHWNHGKKNENDVSCWIRVNQHWTGHSYGMQFIPPVGQPVLVDFIGGDPDCPIILGCLYKSSQRLPYQLPNQSTITGIKSQHHEIRFDDKKASEEIFLHTTKDFFREVNNDFTTDVENDYCITVKGDSETHVQNGTHLMKAQQQISLNAGDNFITIQSDEITISGKVVSLK